MSTRSKCWSTYDRMLSTAKSFKAMTSAAPLLPINHDEAMQLALIKQSESNLARCYVALAAELADAKRELAITSGPVLLANKMLVERDAASIARIATLEKSLREIKFNAGNKTGYGLIWQIAALALGSEQETACAAVGHQIIGKCPNCGNEMVESLTSDRGEKR